MAAVFTGEKLERLLGKFRKFPVKRRPCSYLEGFLAEEPEFRVCILYGLRRTGKTVMMGQALLSLTDEERAKAAWIECRANDDMSAVYEILDRLQEQDFKYVFIDEITLIEDFSVDSALLADTFSPLGLRIVLAGTHSLLFSFAREKSLYDRAYTISTTNILFDEHSAVSGDDDIRNFISSGGIFRRLSAEDQNKYLPFKDFRSTEIYDLTAIAGNIQHSLELDYMANRFGDLAGLYNRNHLTNAICRIMNDINNNFTIRTLKEKFVNRQEGLIRAGLTGRRDLPSDLIKELRSIFKSAEIMDGFKDKFSILDIKPEDFGYAITESHIAQLLHYLFEMNVLGWYHRTTYYEHSGYKDEKLPLVIQPGLRFRQCEYFVEQILNSTELKRLTLSSPEIAKLRDAMLNTIMGRILEEVVLFEVMHSCPEDHAVFQYRDEKNHGEIDLVIYNNKEYLCSLYEIKFSDHQVRGQAKHLTDQALIDQFCQHYGDIQERTVLYRGPDRDGEDGVVWRNVGSFLKETADNFPCVEPGSVCKPV